MLKKVIFLSVVAVYLGSIVSKQLIAQPINNTIGAVEINSPEAYAFGQYVDVPVSYYTGTPGISIPVASVSDGPVSLPISFSYHAGGIQVGTPSNRVGTGWVLNAGGMITRTVQNMEDDKPEGFYYTGKKDVIVNGSFSQDYLTGLKDSEPDIFSFNLSGMTGKFYFDENQQAHIFPKQDIKIEPITRGTVFEGFTITATNGTKYTFGIDLSNNRTATERVISSRETFDAYIDSWYLVKVEDYSGVHSVSLYYEQEEYQYKVLASTEEQQSECFLASGAFDWKKSGFKLSASHSGAYDMYHPFITQMVKGVRLARIESHLDLVHFEKSSRRREDLSHTGSGAYALSKIRVKDRDAVNCKVFKLDQGYFEDYKFRYKNPYSTTIGLNEPESKRLFLKSITEYNCSETKSLPPHTFHYNSPEKSGNKIYFPNRLTKAIDHWGFYNGQKNNNNYFVNAPTTEIKYQKPNGTGNFIVINSDKNISANFLSTVLKKTQNQYGGSNRESNGKFMLYGTLNKIDYPTGGSHYFDLEANTINTTGKGREYKPVTITGCTSPTPGSIQGCCGSTPVTKDISFDSFDKVQHGFLEFSLYSLSKNLITCPRTDGAKLKIQLFKKGENSPFVDLPTIIIKEDNITFKKRIPLMDLFFNGELPKINTDYTLKVVITDGYGLVQLGYHEIVTTEKEVGGLRIKEIRLDDNLVNPIVKKFHYNQENKTDASSGELFLTPTYANAILGPTYKYTKVSGPAIALYNGSPSDIENQMNLIVVNSSGVQISPSKAPRTQYAAIEGVGGGGMLPARFRIDGVAVVSAVTFSDRSYVPLSNFESGIIGYKRVEEEISGLGKKIFNYHHSIDYDRKYNPTYPTTPSHYNEFNGQLSSSKVLDVSLRNTIQSSTYFPKSVSNAKLSKTFYKMGRIVECEETSGILPISDYTLKTASFRLEKVTNTIDGITTTQSFEYDDDNVLNRSGLRFLAPTTTTVKNSEGYEYITKTKYNWEYNTSVNKNTARTLKQMKEMNILAPVEVVQLLKRPTDRKAKLISGTISNYGLVNNLPYLVSSSRTELTSSRLSDWSPSFINGDGALDSRMPYTSHGSKVPEAVVSKRSDRGSLLEFYQQHGNKGAHIWGELEQQPIAVVANAAQSDVRYHGFDTYPAEKWTNLGNNATSDVSKLNPNGKLGKCFEIKTRIGPRERVNIENQQGKYVFSAWVNAKSNGRLYVEVKRPSDRNLTIIEKQFTSTGNKWERVELIVDLSSIRKQFSTSERFSLTINVEKLSSSTPSILVDEIRFHPYEAQMQTIVIQDKTRRVLGGGDARDRHASFEYDEFNRLKLTRNHDGKITTYNQYYTQRSFPSDKTYVKTAALVSPITDARFINTNNSLQQVSYLDGLGRPLQTIQIAQSPLGKDVVSFNEYDKYGRSPRAYLPYVATSSSGVFQNNARTAQASFHRSQLKGVSSNFYAFAETKFEVSPLSRPIEQGNVGRDWQLRSGNVVKSAYRTNTANEVINFQSAGKYYPANELVVTEVTAENGTKVVEYKDKLGRVILSATVSPTATKKVYYIYNELGQVETVLSPKAVKYMEDNNNYGTLNPAIAELVYRYTYDSRGRIATKKVPSRTTERFFYDKRDRQTLWTYDKRQAAGQDKEYLFTKYDNQDRVIMTGKWYAPSLPSNYTAGSLFETRSTSTTGYTDNAFPRMSSNPKNEVQIINYYDNVDGLPSTMSRNYDANRGFTGMVSDEDTRGLLVGSKVMILDGQGKYLIEKAFYNEWGMVIQTQNTNHLNGRDITSTKYDLFNGRVLETSLDHKTQYDAVTYREKFAYDKAGRLLTTNQNINNQGWQEISKNEYNELGQVITNNIHKNPNGTYLQSVDYSFNERGWLTGINDVNNVGNDVFAMQLLYNKKDATLGNTKQYNGNISAVKWSSNSLASGKLHSYTYEYDGFSQLAKAHYTGVDTRRRTKFDEGRYSVFGAPTGTFKKDSRTGNIIDYNTLTTNPIEYDINGNIMNLSRIGLTPTGSELIDALKYTYKTNSDQLLKVDDAGL